ncbi:hypothetical protein NC652_014269 [Populus alba x Populus x berolinensis]|nr:hypothetical protein NC652_014269 [Populus alba x Populus x berolinensis]
MAISHNINKYTNFRKLIRDIIIRGVIDNSNKQMQVVDYAKR